MNDDHEHELWWIYSPVVNEEWGGLRVAHFYRSTDGVTRIKIADEIQQRSKTRDWFEARATELWFKIAPISIPTDVDIRGAAFHAANEEGPPQQPKKTTDALPIEQAARYMQTIELDRSSVIGQG